MIVEQEETIEQKSGEYGEEGNIYQALCKLPDFDGWRPVLGAWIIGDVAAGMGIREDSSLITANMSHFCSHFFKATTKY